VRKHTILGFTCSLSVYKRLLTGNGGAEVAKQTKNKNKMIVGKNEAGKASHLLCEDTQSLASSVVCLSVCETLPLSFFFNKIFVFYQLN
jgi:hypothetical protein